MSPPVTLTARLVVSTVLLVAVVAVLIGSATTLAMRSSLEGRLDQEVAAALDRLDEALRSPDRRDLDPRNQRPGTLLALLGEGGGDGIVLGDGFEEEQRLSLEAVRQLAGLEESEGRSVDLSGLGEYRVRVREGPRGTLVAAGLPATDVDDTLRSLVGIEVAVGLLAVLAAGGLAAVVVRRQLRPLRDVAGTARHVSTLPLAEGEISLRERVPADLTDERTEVGAVGSALNALLAHVEDSLDARHRSEQQVRQFVADASHELRTPLATIKGYAELARRHPDETAQVLTALAKVEVESGRMAGLVEDLLLLARLDAGRPLARERVDLTRLLLETVSDARVLAPNHHWHLDLPDEAVEVVGDGARLHRAVTNLLTNTRRYTPTGTTVTVTGRPGRIEVRDDGPGFPPDLLPRAFERFVRGDVARTRSPAPGEVDRETGGSDVDAGPAADAGPDAGTGLGLSLVAAIVHAHGGTVDLTSVPGETRITIALPGDEDAPHPAGT